LRSATRRDGDNPTSTPLPGSTRPKPKPKPKPVPEPELDAGLLADLIARVNEPAGYPAWQRQVEGAGYCQHPIRLAGRVEQADTTTGEAATVFDTDTQPDRILLKACGTRRAARCASCAQVYRRDAFQLVRAGLAGGKGVPASVGAHPMVFVTFTAPSFGAVHARRERGGTVHPCHPGKLGDHCEHGRRRACWDRHDGDDPILGAPLCADCFDYVGAVVWNALASELWRRTTIYLRRVLARLVGVSRAELGRRVVVSYLKVAEFQRRGLVHYHAVIRLDGHDQAHGENEADGDRAGSGGVAPPVGFTVELLSQAICEAATAVTVPVSLALVPELGGAGGGWVGPRPIGFGWGEQLDLRVIGDGHHQAGERGNAGERDGGDEGGEWPAARLAGYIAKYATKATESFGAGLDRPIRSATELDQLDVPDHVARLVRACWALGGRAGLAGLGLRRWAHMLGYGGHFTTKSRRYSTTFRALRAARRAWVARHRYGPAVALDQDGYLLPRPGMVALGFWRYAGLGYTTAGDAWLAVQMAAQAREMRRVAREELRGAA